MRSLRLDGLLVACAFGKLCVEPVKRLWIFDRISALQTKSEHHGRELRIVDGERCEPIDLNFCVVEISL